MGKKLKTIITKYKSLKRTPKILVTILLIGIMLPLTVTFGRYVYKKYLDYYFLTKNFYFKSNLLDENNPHYTIDSWSGVDTYELQINMNSINNTLDVAKVDIYYDITVTCDETITCNVNKTSSVIRTNNGGSNNSDSFTITAIPKYQFANNEEANIYVTASSTEPYKKIIGGQFTIKAQKVGLSYEIDDNKNNIFATLILTNSMSYYTVETAFGTYNVGDTIEQEKYQTLTPAQKANCSSMNVNLAWDPRVMQIDMTNPYLLQSQNSGKITTGKYRVVISDISGSYKKNDIINETQYNGLSTANKSKVSSQYDYITRMTITIEAIQSIKINYYKTDKTADYTYPFTTASPIITVT